jgi:hypothetical protein
MNLKKGERGEPSLKQMNIVNQNKTGAISFEIIGMKCSLKHEKKLDKRFRIIQSVNFIQKVWRGSVVRR